MGNSASPPVYRDDYRIAALRNELDHRAMPKTPKPAPLPPHPHLTVDEIAGFLRVSPQVIYELVQDREIPALRIGRLIRIARQDFLDWLAAQSGEDEGGKPHDSSGPSTAIPLPMLRGRRATHWAMG